VDLGAARKLAAHLVDNGLDALVVSGTTGEPPPPQTPPPPQPQRPDNWEDWADGAEGDGAGDSSAETESAASKEPADVN